MRAAVRQAVAAPVRPQAQAYRFPAPIRGWVTNENIAFQQPGSALTLENWFPERDAIRVRGGLLKYATLASAAVETMFAYRTGTSEEFFACADGKIYNITSVSDASTEPAAAVTGQTSNQYGVEQFTTSGGDYLYAVNGADDAQLYNGSTWQAVDAASTPAITGVATSSLNNVTAFKNRLWFIEKDSMSAWYLPVDAIGGAATEFPLRKVMTKGGRLVFAASWSLDAGDGVDDKLLFVSDQGQAALYEGTDPSSASTWALAGVYDVAKPLGLNPYIQAGGDLAIATAEGFVPISQALRKDPAALSLSALSFNIEPDWKRSAQQFNGGKWTVTKWTDGNMAVVGIPRTSTSQEAFCYPINLETGAWCKFTGWDVQSATVINGQLYIGTIEGHVFACEQTGTDNGQNYVSRYASAFDDMRTSGQFKALRNSRPTFQFTRDFTAQLSFSVNYEPAFPLPPNAASDSTAGTGVDSALWGTSAWGSFIWGATTASPSDDSVWGTAVWDTNVWGGAATQQVDTVWRSVSGVGHTFSLQVQITNGDTQPPDVRLIATDVTFEAGGLVN
jgi:hypothetical protein